MVTDDKPRLTDCYVASDDVVAREIDGDILIVPVAAGIGDAEGELYGLGPTARAVWERLDGRKNLQEIIQELALEYEGPLGRITEETLAFMEELLNRRLVVKTVSGPP